MKAGKYFTGCTWLRARSNLLKKTQRSKPGLRRLPGHPWRLYPALKKPSKNGSLILECISKPCDHPKFTAGKKYMVGEPGNLVTIESIDSTWGEEVDKEKGVRYLYRQAECSYGFLWRCCYLRSFISKLVNNRNLFLIYRCFLLIP